MLELTSKLSEKIYNLTWGCTFLILLMHLPYAGVAPTFMSAPMFGVTMYDVTRLSVPMFFFISGFLLARHCNEQGWYVTALKKRFKTLVVPYIALNLLYLPLLIIYHNYLGLGEWPTGGVRFSLYTVIRVFGLSWHFHPVVGTLWYIRCLMMFIIISPILVVTIRKYLVGAILTLLFLIGGVLIVESKTLGEDARHILYSFFNLRGVLFFSMGIAISCHGAQIFEKRSTKIASVLLLTVGCLLLRSLNLNVLTNGGSLFVWCVFLFVIWQIVPSLKLPRWITSSSFALFALHPVIYKILSVIMPRFVNLLDVNLLAIGALIITMGCVYLVTLVIRRKIPMLSNILFGGRC